MHPGLEIIIPLRNPGPGLVRAAASLAAQTDRRFTVLLSDDFSSAGLDAMHEARSLLSAAGIPFRCVKPPVELKRLEHWNWAHSQSDGEWLKLLPPCGALRPAFVQQFRRRLQASPQARFIRCDLGLDTEWGPETERAPFTQAAISPAEFARLIPAAGRWLSHPENVAYSRLAWLAAGGYATQFAACAPLHFNLTLALRHGVENLPETLALTAGAGADAGALNGRRSRRVNLTIEWWLIFRQARNYCQAAKLPWAGKWLLAGAFAAARCRR
jgi:hypothetical protein